MGRKKVRSKLGRSLEKKRIFFSPRVECRPWVLGGLPGKIFGIVFYYELVTPNPELLFTLIN
jgi:hypothetical protein